MSGQLYKFNFKEEKEVEPNFCFVVDGKINNKANWSKRYQGIRNKNPLVMHVKDFDLTKETATALGTRGTAAAATMATAVAVAMEDYNKVKKEWKETGKIPGGIFLTVNDSKYIWISNADLKYFEKVLTT